MNINIFVFIFGRMLLGVGDKALDKLLGLIGRIANRAISCEVEFAHKPGHITVHFGNACLDALGLSRHLILQMEIGSAVINSNGTGK